MLEEPKFKSVSQAEVDRLIAQAHHMRAEHVARWTRIGTHKILNALRKRIMRPNPAT